LPEKKFGAFEHALARTAVDFDIGGNGAAANGVQPQTQINVASLSNAMTNQIAFTQNGGQLRRKARLSHGARAQQHMCKPGMCTDAGHRSTVIGNLARTIERL
jgi:hypothetical protein